MKRIRTAFLPLLIAASIFTQPQSASSKVKIPLTVKLILSSSYDDNILKYSPRDLDRFETNREIHPSEITTADDWINTFGVRVYRDFKLGRNFRLRPYYSGRVSLYSVNQLKNTHSHYLLARISYRYRVYIYLQYSYLPGYYLRVYKDRDLDEYRACDFDLYRPSVRLRYRFLPYQIEGQFGREAIYYNSHFTEYDSEASFWKLMGSYKTPVDLEISLGYEFKISDNIGFSQSDLISSAGPDEDTEYGDSSYEEDRFSLGASYRLPLKSSWGWEVSLDIERRLRYYQSNQPLDQDPFHAGRKDRRDLIVPKISCSPSSYLDLEFNFTYDRRKATSPDPVVPSIKNFVDRTFEFTVIYQVF